MNTPKITLNANNTPVANFDWEGNCMRERTLTCRDHRNLRWFTKYIGMRSLHFYGTNTGEYVPECECPTSYLLVVG